MKVHLGNWVVVCGGSVRDLTLALRVAVESATDPSDGVWWRPLPWQLYAQAAPRWHPERWLRSDGLLQSVFGAGTDPELEGVRVSEEKKPLLTWMLSLRYTTEGAWVIAACRNMGSVVAAGV